jgi:flavoprotein
MTKRWTSIEDWIADPFIPIIDVVSEHDCMYPDCLIEANGCRTCEHACPFEKVKNEQTAK